MKKRWVFLSLLLSLLFLVGATWLVGCGQAGTAEPVTEEAVPVVSPGAEGEVIAEAVIEPVRWGELRFTGGGRVVEVLVDAGDEVAEGELLVRLNPTDAGLRVQEAEAALAAARAQLAQVKAGPRAEEIAEAEARLSDAEAALSRAVARRDELTGGALEAGIAAAQAEVAAAQAEQLRVREEHRDVHEQAGSGADADRAKEDADYRLYAANEALAAAAVRLQAQQNITAAQQRDVGAGVWLAAANVDVAQAELELLEAGVVAEDVAVSEAAVQQAEAALATARAALERTELRAPFAGTVTQVNVEVGETATPGQVIVVLATLDRLQVRTSDLTELDVARVAEGQAATVTVDALPNLRLSGHVARIDLQSVDYRGDVTYPIYIELDGAAPELRWGMTAMVEIEAG
jgi:HlyD family secretion protein